LLVVLAMLVVVLVVLMVMVVLVMVVLMVLVVLLLVEWCERDAGRRAGLLDCEVCPASRCFSAGDSGCHWIELEHTPNPIFLPFNPLPYLRYFFCCGRVRIAPARNAGRHDGAGESEANAPLRVLGCGGRCLLCGPRPPPLARWNASRRDASSRREC
jgi:hypothetical protein